MRDWRGQRRRDKVIMIIFAFILAIGFLITSISIMEISKLKKENMQIKITAEDDNLVIIKDIKLNGNIIDKKNIDLSKSGFEFRANQIVGKNANLCMEFSKADTVEIVFLSNYSSGNVKIESDRGIIEKKLFSEDSDDYIYQYRNSVKSIFVSYIKSAEKIPITIAVFIAGFIIESLLLYICLLFIVDIKNKRLNVLRISRFLVALFVICLTTLYSAIEMLGIIFIFVVFIILAYIMYRLRNILFKELEYNYVLLSGIIGIIMLMLLPPAHALDEEGHFLKAYNASLVFQEEHNELKRADSSYGRNKISMNNEFEKLLDTYSFKNGSAKEINSKVYIINLYKSYSDFIKTDINYEREWDFSNTEAAPMLAYIPATIGCFLCRTLNMPPIVFFQFTRLINMIIATIICFYALKIMPIFKKIMYLVMLFPIAVQQSFGNNQDWLTHALCFLFIAYLFREIYSDEKYEKIENKTIIKLVIISVLLSYCKVGYFPLALLSLLIPSRRFKNRKHEILIKAAIILPVFILSFLQYFSRGVMTKEPWVIEHTGEKLNTYSIGFILDNPIEAIKIYMNTFYTYNAHFFLSGLISNFGWTTHLANSTVFIIMFLIYIFLIVFNKEEKETYFPMSHRLFNLFIFIMTAGIIFTSMFVTWTPFGKDEIMGIQPRYFIPVLPSLYIAVQNRFFKLKCNFNNVFNVSILCMLIVGIGTIVKGYFL